MFGGMSWRRQPLVHNAPPVADESTMDDLSELQLKPETLQRHWLPDMTLTLTDNRLIFQSHFRNGLLAPHNLIPNQITRTIEFLEANETRNSSLVEIPPRATKSCSAFAFDNLCD